MKTPDPQAMALGRTKAPVFLIYRRTSPHRLAITLDAKQDGSRPLSQPAYAQDTPESIYNAVLRIAKHLRKPLYYVAYFNVRTGDTE